MRYCFVALMYHTEHLGTVSLPSDIFQGVLSFSLHIPQPPYNEGTCTIAVDISVVYASLCPYVVADVPHYPSYIRLGKEGEQIYNLSGALSVSGALQSAHSHWRYYHIQH